jgi:hypothetical protein
VAKEQSAQPEYYPVKTAKQGNIYVARNVAGPPPYGWGVTFSEIKQSLNKFNQAERITHEGASVRLFWRQLTPTGGPACNALVFVAARRESVVDVALRIYPDLCDDVESKKPLEIVRQFAERFGLEIQIGSKKARLFQRETIRLGPGQQSQPISVPGDRRGSLCFFGNRTEISCSVALAFCVDVAAYAEWLEGR